MKYPFVRRLFLLPVLLLLSCAEKDSPPETPLRFGVVGSECSDLTGSDTSFQVFIETLDLWARTFVGEHMNDSADYFCFSIPADSLGKYLSDPPGCGGGCYAGVKAYFGLEDSISSLSEVADYLCMILVPYTADGTDTVFPSGYGPFIKVDTGSERFFIDSTEAQEYIDNWGAHFEGIEKEIAVPTYAYVLPMSTLQGEINKAGKPGFDGEVYLVLGYHTISPQDTLYCFENSKGHRDYPYMYGYAVHALILSARRTAPAGTPGTFEHSSDFLRPCPRFCGDPKFTLTFP